MAALAALVRAQLHNVLGLLDGVEDIPAFQLDDMPGKPTCRCKAHGFHVAEDILDFVDRLHPLEHIFDLVRPAEMRNVEAEVAEAVAVDHAVGQAAVGGVGVNGNADAAVALV